MPNISLEKTEHLCSVFRFLRRFRMTEPTNGQESVALGTWIGREQAFNALAHHCSKARVACLKQIHDTEAYKGLNLTWAEFCPSTPESAALMPTASSAQ